jgi:hypothetical protein
MGVTSRSPLVRSPIVSTSKRPSSGSASGQMIIPPPNVFPFATTTSCMWPTRLSPSTVTRSSEFCHFAKTAKVAQRYEILPPRAFVVSFARWAIAPLMPALATFAKCDSAALPSQAR